MTTDSLTELQRKEFATMQAKAALHGGIEVKIVPRADGRLEFSAAKWHYTTTCSTLEALRVLLRRMGAPV